MTNKQYLDDLDILHRTVIIIITSLKKIEEMYPEIAVKQEWHNTINTLKWLNGWTEGVILKVKNEVT